MSFFGNFDFYLVLLVLMIPAITLGFMEKSLKSYRMIVSIYMIVRVFWGDKKQLIYFLLFYFIGYILIYGYLKLRYKKGGQENKFMYYLFVLLAILPLCVGKVTGMLTFSSMNIFQFLGVSYLTFRVVQIIIEIYDGIIKEIRWSDYTDFLLLFSTFSAGPIDRSRRYIEDGNRVYQKKEYFELLGDGIFKILLGIVYKFILAAFASKGMLFFETPKEFIPYVAYAYLYGLNLFFDFAGYSLMAVGVSYIFGIRVPDNFDKPFISKDIKEFWNRWHITLSFWFRDFIFSRFMMAAIRGKWFSARLTGATVGFLINMFIMGVWHGITVSYICYGVYHGILLAVTEVYQKKSKFYRAHKNAGWYRIISWFITINLVIFGFLIFSGKLI